jgi:hypothetical protein
VHSPALIIVTNHIIELQAEAQANRLAKQAKRPESRSASRIAAALSNLRSLLTNPADGPVVLPRLVEYPYKS